MTPRASLLFLNFFQSAGSRAPSAKLWLPWLKPLITPTAGSDTQLGVLQIIKALSLNVLASVSTKCRSNRATRDLPFVF